MLFEVQDLSKRFGDIAALTGVSFHVRAGEILGLIGPNGAGKSTLFECLAGVLPSDSGRITTDRLRTLFYIPDTISPWSAQPVAWALDYTIGFFGGRRDLRDEIVGQLDLAALLRRP